MIQILLRAGIALAVLLGILAGWHLGAPPDEADLQAVAVAPATRTGPPTLTIQTTRQGNHHVMRATVVGQERKTLVVPFLVDTGASTVALPASMMDDLGFEPADLEDWLVDTANGRIRVKKGRLASIEIGGLENHDVLYNVDAVFIADSALGHPLMGMNVLGQYRMTIDDRDQIVLVKKR